MAITLSNVTVFYGSLRALDGVSGTFDKGSLTAVVGSNGSGKSTLFKVLMGLLSPHQGSVQYGDTLPQDMAYLPQHIDLDKHFPLLVSDVVAMGLWRKVGAFKAVSPQQVVQISDALTHVGLQGFEDRPLHKLSGGQFQRVLFARMIVQDAQVILLDEPFAAVDEETVEDLLVLIKEWNQQGRTVIAVLHDRNLVESHFPMTLRLNGFVKEWGPTPGFKA
jgi:zinc/manganese transport system ATP-binding protein